MANSAGYHAHYRELDETYHRSDHVKKELRKLISKYGFAAVLAELARYAHSPDTQAYPPRVFAVAFRRLNAVYEYLTSQT